MASKAIGHDEYLALYFRNPIANALGNQIAALRITADEKNYRAKQSISAPRFRAA
jgi:hypothetical protein